MSAATALITGASSGIGYHLAHEFARHQHPLVLVARSEADLQVVASEIAASHGVHARIVAQDLEKADAVTALMRVLERDGVPIDLLVNNAGVGFRGNFWTQPLEQDLTMLRLNIEAVLRLTKALLPPMLERGHGRILNTASVAGFEPGPHFAVYHATKAFLLSWSEALAVELEESPITVTALCPGPTDTEFFRKAGMVASRVFQKTQVMPPQEVARAGYEAMMAGELFVVPGAMNKALVAARRILPERTQARLNARFYEDVPPDEVTRTPGEIALSAGPQ